MIQKKKTSAAIVFASDHQGVTKGLEMYEIMVQSNVKTPIPSPVVVPNNELTTVSLGLNVSFGVLQKRTYPEPADPVEHAKSRKEVAGDPVPYKGAESDDAKELLTSHVVLGVYVLLVQSTKQGRVDLCD